MNTARRCLFYFCLALPALVALASCNRHPVQWEPRIETLAPSPPLVWTITATPPKGQDASVFFYQCPEGRKIYSGPAKDMITWWGYGYLLKGPGGVEWRDLDPASGVYNKDTALDLTSWDTPVAVDPKNRMIFAFGNAVAPSRKLFAHYLNGNPPILANELVAQEYETLTPLSNTGWPVFYVDRPNQARAISPDTAPTRRMRVYDGATLGGEFPNVLGVFLLQGCVALQDKDGWFLVESNGLGAVTNRSMSLAQITGALRPLARIDDTILVASDQLGSDGKTFVASTLHTYGIYTRLVEKIWDPGAGGSAQKILALTPIGPSHYIAVLGALPDQKVLTMGRLKDGVWEPMAKATLDSQPVNTFVFLIPETTPGTGEATQESGAETESVVQSEGSVAGLEGAINPSS